MNYFRTVNPTEWSVPDFYHSYKAVFPAKKREDIVFAIRKDLDLLSKDDNAASAKAAKNLINGWQKLNFPSDAPSSESAQAEADNDTKLSQGNITFSNISGDVNLENTQYFNHDVQHHKRKIEDAAGSSQKRVASDSSVHQHSLLQSIPGADSFQVDSFHESNLDQYYGFEIWDMWSSFFYSSQENDELFMYSPEKFGIVTCGKGISKKSNMPGDAYIELNEHDQPKSDQPNCVDMFQAYVDNALDAETSDAMEEAARSLPRYTATNKNAAFFLQDMLLVFARDMFHPNADPSHSESGYNSLLPHPTLRAVVAAISNQQFQFVPGEEQLVAMSVQLKRRLPMFSEREAYNADGVVRLTIDKGFTTELLVLETSRAYNKAEKTKSAYDHHKAMFALLAMVKALADKYPMAYFENIAAIKVFFLHVYDDKMRLWSMSTPRKDVYIMRREFSVHVPICIEERDPHVVKYLKAFWSLKDLLKKSGESIMKMQQAHKHAARIYRYKKYPRDLLSDIVNPAIVKLTESKNSKGMHDQLPNSSLAGSGTCSFELRQ